MKRSEVDRSRLSPMMSQYMEIKDNYPSELIFYRLGDFYELFFEDALIASRELELTLTGRVAGLEERVPMCGVPQHTVKNYIEKLVNKGYRVAIVEQLEDAKNTNKMVKRGVVDVYSKGTIADSELLSEKDTSYIASVLYIEKNIYLTILDISTGHLSSLKLDDNTDDLVNEILNHNIKEVVVENDIDGEIINILKNTYGIEITINDQFLEDKYQDLLETIDDENIVKGIKHLFYYLSVRQLKDLSYVSDVKILTRNLFLEMNVHTIRNLELVETLRLKERTYSLVWLLDKCKTAMGSRKLKEWLLNPLKNRKIIEDRFDKIDKLKEEFIIREELRNLLYEVYDIERLAGKTSNGHLNGRDLLQLKVSLGVLPQIKTRIEQLGFNYDIDLHRHIYDLLESSIVDNPPISIKEGGIFKSGYNSELDELKSIRSGGKEYIARFESEIKEQTGIKTLKVGFNKVFGYYIEVTKGQKDLVKDEFRWERKQTLTNCERYISPELKEKEALILNAEEKINDLEYDLFVELKQIIQENVIAIRKTAEVLSEIDCLLSLCVCSEEYNFVRPKFNDEGYLKICDGRHPVVEVVSKIEYVPNDCVFEKGINTLLITGPNMSGKSTYMRQLAIISIMAQMGSFVPASSAILPIFDKIFTRIGASDDLVSGESTFMVEMKEARNAIVNATKNSLILFDELGRGTATYDGIALAQGILEYLSKHIGAFTLFSTHYHELTKLDKDFPNIKNVHVSAVEKGDEITFLHKIKDGAVDKSYGIHVAKLAKMPTELLQRAKSILKTYETGIKSEQSVQLALDFNSNKDDNNVIVEKLENADILEMTPIEALNFLYELKQELKKGD